MSLERLWIPGKGKPLDSESIGLAIKEGAL